MVSIGSGHRASDTESVNSKGLTMKKFVLPAFVAAAVVTAEPALAADLKPVYKAAPAPVAVSPFDVAVGAAVMTDYYDLAFERRPEFMGFSQVEPTTPIRIGDYVRSGGAEAQARIDRYAALAARADALAAKMPADRKDAFF